MSGRRSRRPRRGWTRYSDERLSRMRLCDLDLRIEGTWIERCVDRLYDELAERGIRFRPHVWLSSEWFSPDGIPGIAIPFFLAHPRLIRIERRQMLEVEGGTFAGCMRLLRHEAGHAIDTAYRLHFKPNWRKVFGRYSVPYPDSYRPRPNSRSYVVHLEAWYAQAHPAEDFAETFAVWLAPRSAWRQRYKDWPQALRKLRYVDRLMRDSVVDLPPRVRSRARIEPAGSSKLTIGEFYEAKRERYGGEWPSVFDRDLQRLFSDAPRYRDRPAASRFLRGLRKEIRDGVAEWTGVHTYTVDQVLQDVVDRCRRLKLRLTTSEEEARTQAMLLLTVHTMSSLHTHRYEVPL